MRVKIEYISNIELDNISVPFYITEDNEVYMGSQIMPYIKSKQQIKQTVITDIDNAQYDVYPLIEVCRFIKKKEFLIKFNTANIAPKEHKEIPKEEQETTEFMLAIKKLGVQKNKKK